MAEKSGAEKLLEMRRKKAQERESEANNAENVVSDIVSSIAGGGKEVEPIKANPEEQKAAGLAVVPNFKGKKTEKTTMRSLRVQKHIDSAIEYIAKENGISYNKVANLLLEEALTQYTQQSEGEA